MAYTLDDLGKTLIHQLYDIVCEGDRSVSPARDTFLTWCHPGMPVKADELDFAAKGLGTATDKELVNDAFAFARMVDFVPDVDAAYTHDRQREMLAADAHPRLSTLYGDILRCAKVVHAELTDEDTKKIEKFRHLLRSTKRVTDIVTGEQKEVTEDGPMFKAYHEKLAAYLAAALRYNTKRVAARSATGVDRLQVKTAMDAWISGGYRNEVDQIIAYIDQINRRDLVLWRRALVQMYDDAVIDAVGHGRQFHNTTPVPADVASSRGWTRYQVGHEAVDSRTHSVRKSWRAGAGVWFGLSCFVGGASGRAAQYNESFAIESFKLSFELCQVLISRPWFYPEFFANRGWTLRKGNGWTSDQLPSDGGDPPKGNLVGYPAAILFARDVRIESAEFSKAYSEYAKEVGGEATVGWGPFSLGGGYSRAERKAHFHSETDSRGLSVPGMQIIGFVNHLLGKTPNPLPELEPERFV